jgi:NADH-quinone oxidoreductase subunit L
LDAWDQSLSASLIRWIAILPMLSAFVHGLLIGIVRTKMSARSVWTISLSALGTSFGLSMLSLFELVGGSDNEPLLDTLGPWIGGGVGQRSFSAELALQFDTLSAVFSLAVVAIAFAIYLYTIGLQKSGEIDDESGHRTFAMLDLLVGSTLILILADNFLLFFLGWTGVGIASQLFSSFTFDTKESARAGATTFVIARIGDLGLLGAMLLLFDGLARAGAASLTFRGIRGAYRLLEGQELLLVQQTGFGAPDLLEMVGFGLVLAAVTKCAQLPLHIWLTNAVAPPIPAAALMQSATTVVAGVYVLLRFSFLLESAPGAMTVLIGLGASTLFLASLAAATQLDVSRFLAYTTASHLGLVMIGIGLGAYSSAAFHLLTHAFMKGHLILALGVVAIALRGETDLRKMGGIGNQMRWTHWVVVIGFLALAGCPPLSGFFSIEELLAFVHISGRAESGALLVIILVSLGILAFAMGRVFFLIFWGNVRPGGLAERRLQDPAGWTQHALTGFAVMTVIAGWLTPSQFWGDPWGVAKSDSVGHFLVFSIAGAPDPGLVGAPRFQLVVALVIVMATGIGLSAYRYARRGYRGEPERASLRFAIETMREMFFIEEFYRIVLVRPLRAVSRWALVAGIEERLLDRVVVTGGSGLVRRFIWTGLRRIQNGRLQSYALLGLLTVLVVVTWMVS